jgi:hypothetical protein
MSDSSSVAARYACTRCVLASHSCRIIPGRRSCIRCTSIRRRCVTQHVPLPSLAMLRTSIQTIRAHLASMVDELRNFDDGNSSDREESSAGNSFITAFSPVP